VKPTVTRIDVQPDESVIKFCKPDFAACGKFVSIYGS